jgi:hypothetical protein
MSRDVHSLKARDIVLQNPDSTFPAPDSVLAIGGGNGQVTATRDIHIDSFVGPVADIDSSGNITAHTLILDSSGAAITTAGNMYVHNANIINSGFVQTRELTLLDLSANIPTTHLFPYAGNLFWQRDASYSLLNISRGLLNLAVDPGLANLPLITGNDDPNLVVIVNLLLQLFTNRGIFLALT